MVYESTDAHDSVCREMMNMHALTLFGVPHDIERSLCMHSCTQFDVLCFTEHLRIHGQA
jgi:hypothetical protein